MRYFPIIMFVFVCFSGYGQKETQKVIDASNISAIFISTDEVFKIDIATAPVETITIKSRSSGEYYNNIGIKTEVKRENLIITSQFREKLLNGFDKLSTHQGFSIEMELIVPRGLNVEIISNLASVYGEGKYKNVLIQLKSGSCFLKDFTGNAHINTFAGNIEIETKNARVTARSRQGNLHIAAFDFERYKLDLTSISGNISVQKMN